MNAIEIEQAVFELNDQKFDSINFPYYFLEAFGNKVTTIKKLRSGVSNKSDLNGVLQRNNVHIVVCSLNEVSQTLQDLRTSSATIKSKVRFIISTDGNSFEAEDLKSGEIIACEYKEFSNHFGFFLPLAGISTIKQIRDNAIDIRATSRLNRLYVEIIKANPEWGNAEKKNEMNMLMARLIFCFFAEDTDIFGPLLSFTKTVEQMSDGKSTNTNYIISEIFRTMNLSFDSRTNNSIQRWANKFPYVNGGLFSGSVEVPIFTKIAKSYLIHLGNLDWQKINPDIFGSMIQAVTEEEERDFLGMHYTSVPNILKVLNPLFINDLKNQVDLSKNNPKKLLNLRKRLSKIRVFDPACGSGNFLVIAYKEMREIENQINSLRDESGRKSDIPLTNFRGIEIRNFSCEIARLALIIAEYQCDVIYVGQKEAIAKFLPLEKNNWIICGNALSLDWGKVCPRYGNNIKIEEENLFKNKFLESEVQFDNEGGEVFICGNPPYVGDKKQNSQQKSDLEKLFSGFTKKWKSLDYVSGWFIKASEYANTSEVSFAFVSTNSITQGQQVPILWPLLLKKNLEIYFAHTSFKWTNLASNNAGVIVVIIGIRLTSNKEKLIINLDKNDNGSALAVSNISPYLVPGKTFYVEPRQTPLSNLPEMLLGNFAKDGGHLILDYPDLDNLDEISKLYIRPMFGGQEFIKSKQRFCLWIEDDDYPKACSSSFLKMRFESVRRNRLQSPKKATREWAKKPYRFVEIRSPKYIQAMVIPIVSSANRDYYPVGFLPPDSIVNYAFGLYDAPLWTMSIIMSKLHLVWIKTVCGKMKSDYRYSNTLGWNTFPLPKLTEKNKIDLTDSVKNILISRENYFPMPISELYNPENMPLDLKNAHMINDEILERIYIGRNFKNDTERLEKLFDLNIKLSKDSKSNSLIIKD